MPTTRRAISPEQRNELERWAAAQDGGWRLEVAVALAPDDSPESDTGKADGYGHPIHAHLADASGQHKDVVFHFASEDEFGHDRRSDRALQQLLAFDTFGDIPGHVRALDVGAVGAGSRLVSWRDGGGEPYLVTEWAPGIPYAEDLRRIAAHGRAEPSDLERVDALVDWLVALHTTPVAPAPHAYLRAARDLIGSGEGIFGMIDAYPADAPGASRARLRAIESACLERRWQLKEHTTRLRRIHGDFHPFNVVFGDAAEPHFLDASRGCLGDPADDVTAMAINFVFFALERPAAWANGLGPLWRRFWTRYLDKTKDNELLDVLAPFLAWRGLVVASPRFYPHLHGCARSRVLELVERTLAAPRFNPEWAEVLFR